MKFYLGRKNRVNISQIIEDELRQEHSDAARAHLVAGRAIYYSAPEHPDLVIKEYPDGQRDLVDFDAAGTETTLRTLACRSCG
jgi:hypothetical protein